MIERCAKEAQHVRSMIDETLIADLPRPPVSTWIRRRDRPLAIGHWVRRIGNILAVFLCLRRRGLERERSVAVQIKTCSLGLHRRPRTVCVPRVRTSLKGARLPDWLLAFAMQVVTEKWRLDLLAK